jgi:hypothetical protein
MPEGPVVAEVRKARAELYEEVGFDLGELVRLLSGRAKASGRKVVERSAGRKRVWPASGG